MYFSTDTAIIDIHNVVSVLRGTVPMCFLEQNFNPHLLTRWSNALLPGFQTFDATTGRFLTGLLPLLKQELLEMGIHTTVRDHRLPLRQTERWALVPGVRLRDYQRECVERAAARPMGLIQAGTGAGKTVMAAALIARLGVPTLWLTTTRVLLQQTVAALHRFLGVTPGIIGGGRHDPAPLTVALVQAIARTPSLVPPGRFQLLIFDEGHHGAAPTFACVVRHVDAARNYFLTAVPERGGNDQIVLSSLAGGVVAAVPTARLVHQRWLCPVEARWEEMPIHGDMTELQFPTIYQRFICENEGRNCRIAALAQQAAADGERVLVLVERIGHGRRLLALLGKRAGFLHGRVGSRRTSRLLERFRDGSLPILVATASLCAEGMDVTGISAIVWAGGMKSRLKTIQAVGRGMRLSPGKRRCLYIDFMDRDQLGVLLAHSRARRRTLEEIGLVPPAATGTHHPREE